MTEVMTYNQPNFANVIQSINAELQDRGHLRADGAEDEPRIEENSPAMRALAEYRQLVTEMRSQNYDVIRFATYRTACKLRFIQRKSNLFLVDIFNVIEAFRENGLNSLDSYTEVNNTRLEAILTTIYFHLNKRLPNASQISAEQSSSTLLNWLSNCYDIQNTGRYRVLSIKVGLAMMSAGKLMDKLRYVFTLISDGDGIMLPDRFRDYLQEVLALPTAVFEGPSFGFNDTAVRSCFDARAKVTVNDFLDTMMSDPGPQCMMWLPILHRMAQVENVLHPVQCEGCNRESFMGFRYKCQRCYNYHLCQDCFWRGRVSGNHSNDHEMKEYSTWKSPAKQFGHSLKKSFRCAPTRPNHRIPKFPETPEKTIDLTHIVPATPVPSHNGFHDTSRNHSVDLSSMDSSSATKSPSKLMNSTLDRSTRVDEEHRLIARYAARLAADANNGARSPTELTFSLDANKAQRELIIQLETKNREILREIQRLRVEQEQTKTLDGLCTPRNPTLLAELRLLRQRRDELEARMSALQESRRDLMVQLEGLMKLLKTQGSPSKGSPLNSPHIRSKSQSPPPLVMPRGASLPPASTSESLMGVSGELRQAFSASPAQRGASSSTSSVRSLRNDLLVAADSVTNAMSSLVKELNSEASGSSDEDEDPILPRVNDHSEGALAELASWREDMKQRINQETDFMMELHARKHNDLKYPNGQYPSSGASNSTFNRSGEESMMVGTDDGESYVKTDDDSYMRTDEEDAELYDRDPKSLVGLFPPRYLTDEDSCLETDQESYIHTEDEEGGNTEWEDALRRWVNR